MAEPAYLDRGQFKDWLLGKEPGEIVGEAGQACQCPIANFLDEIHGPTHHSVGTRTYVVFGFGPTKDLPDWAANFIRNVDRIRVDDIEVEREFALRVLELA